MSLRPLTFIELDGPSPDGHIIPSAWFDARAAQAQALDDAERQIALMLGAARRKATSILRQAEKRQRRMRRELLVERALMEQKILQRCELKWLKQHVTRVLEDAAQERQIIRYVADRIQGSIEQVLNAWLGQKPRDDTLCARLARQVEKLAGERALSLQIHPALVPRMKAEWGDRLTIVPTPHFARDEMRLSSAHCSVAFSLDRHFTSLLAWLRVTAVPTGESDENDRWGAIHDCCAGSSHPASAGEAENDRPAGDGASGA